jgi:hypothetical protein
MKNEQQFLLDFTPQNHHLRWLTEHLDGWQFGEQGLVDAIVSTIKPHGLAIEFGAGDGGLLPLTIDRIYQSHRGCILVEIDDSRRILLQNSYPKAIVDKTIAWNCMGKLQKDLAVVVIDIDGQDSVVMREMFAAGVRPAVLVVEHFDNHFPIATTKPEPIPEWMLGLKLASGHAIQDTAETLHAIATANGYERIGWNRCNSFFVVRERYTDLFR